ncbi:MAG: Crp/Fnr family transcriptional regulator [Verrucomicrobiales bacterium]
MSYSTDTLPAIGILSDLSEDELSELASFGTFLKNRKGDKLVEQGAMNAFIHLVLEGELRVAVASHDAIVTLGYVHAGECVGEMTMLEPVKPAVAGVMSASDSHVWAIQRDDFDRFVDEFPSAGAKMLRGIAVLIAGRLRKTDQHVVAQAT